MKQKLVKLGSVCDLKNGFAFKSKLFKEKGLPVLRISNIQNQRIDTRRPVYFDINDYKIDFKKYEVNNGDLLIAMSGATTGKIGFNESQTTFYLNQRVGKLVPGKDLDKKYLYYILSTKVEENLKISKGTAQPNLSSEQIKNIEFILPSLSEQRHLVAKLDAVLSEVDKLKLLNNTKCNEIMNLKRSTIARILEQRKDEIKKIELHKVVTRLTNGYVGATKNIYQDNGIPYLLARHVKNNKLKFDNKTYISQEFNNNNKKSILSEDDMLLVQSGHIGNTAVVPKEHEGHNCHAMIIITTDKKILSGKYLSILFNSSKYKSKLLKLKTGSTIPHLNCGNVKNMIIEIPSKNTQEKIISIEEENTKNLDELETNFLKINEEINNLKSSILREELEIKKIA